MDLIASTLADFLDQSYLPANKVVTGVEQLLKHEHQTEQKPKPEPIGKSSNKKRHECQSCDMTYSKRQYLMNHMIKEHNEVMSADIKSIRQPIYMATEDNPKPYKCDQCVKEYSKAKHLARHKRSHIRQFCDQCEKSFANFADHMRKIHDTELPRPFECDICHRTYRSKSNIQAHMKIHKSENRIYSCKLCPKAFFYGTDLRKHIRTHSRDRSVICEVCGAAFKSVDTLKCHVRRHTGERPYQCSQCSRSFTTSNSLEIHNRTHTGEKPFQCDGCDKRFSDSSTLLVHKRLHTNESPYCCHLCGRRTKQASNLRSHYKHFHKNTDITGRQIRLNAKIFARFTQSEIDLHLQQSGDLMAILAKGLEDYTNEENEKYNMTEKVLETLSFPSTPTIRSAPVRRKKVQTKIADVAKPTAPVLPASAFSENEISSSLRNLWKLNFELSETSAAPKIKNIIEPMPNFTSSSSINNQIDNTICKTELCIGKVETNRTEKEFLQNTSTTNHYVEEPALKADMESLRDNNYPQNIESVFIEDPSCPTSLLYSQMEIKNECDYEEGEWTGNDYFANQNNSESDEDKANNWCNTVTDFVKCELPDSTDTNLSTINPTEYLDNQFHETDRAYNNRISTAVENNEAKSKIEIKSKKSKLKRTSLKKSIQPQKVCLVCKRKYQNLKKHLVQHHSNLERPYECFMCHKDYKKMEHLRFHLRTHWSERNFICHFCGDGFLLNSDLKKHIFNRHSNIRPHQCKMCAKSFKNRHAMQVHLRTHSGEKPYKCAVCSESFSAMSSLRIHERRHTGEKPYVCNYCNKGFSDCSTHRQHVRIHTGEKPYVCHLCGRRTTQAGNLKSHYRHYHKLVVKNVSMYMED